MAFERRLNVGWMLGDGIAEPFPIGRGRLVADALRAAGMPIQGAFERSWRYVTSFETPLEADERVYLCFEQVWGSASVTVNGQLAGWVRTGEAIVDVTACLAPEDNQLILTFKPAPGAAWLGFCGDVRMITGNGLFMTRLTVHKNAVDLAVRVDSPGKYDFQYTANADGALALRQRFTETLDAGEARLRHALDIKSPQPAPLNVRLNVVRNGVGCVQADFVLPSIENDEPPRRVLVYHGAPVPTEAAQAMAQIGAQAIYAPDEPPRRLEAPQYGSLKRLDDVPSFEATARGDDWLTAFCQAHEMLRRALYARQRGQLAAFHWNAPNAGLVNQDGSPRMAYHTLKRAWDKWCVWVDAPESVPPRGSALMDVWVHVDESVVGQLCVTMRAYDGTGQQIAQRQEYITCQSKGVAAVWQITAPDSGVIILCTHMRDEAGHEASMDQLLPVGNDEFASVTRPASIHRQGDMAENVGDTPAFAPGRCLLPGEKCTIAQEWVNEQRV